MVMNARPLSMSAPSQPAAVCTSVCTNRIAGLLEEPHKLFPAGPGIEGTYLDEVWCIDDRTGGITVADLNDNTGSERHFYHQNTLYHVYALTDETGAIAEAVQNYDSYGNVTALITGAGTDTVWFTADDVLATNPNVSAVGNPYFYTGQRLDPETGLMYFKLRYYVPELGRFTNRNPWGYIHMLPSLYDYVSNRSTGWIEPMSGETVAVGLGAAIVAAAAEMAAGAAALAPPAAAAVGTAVVSYKAGEAAGEYIAAPIVGWISDPVFRWWYKDAEWALRRYPVRPIPRARPARPKPTKPRYPDEGDEPAEGDRYMPQKPPNPGSDEVIKNALAAIAAAKMVEEACKRIIDIPIKASDKSCSCVCFKRGTGPDALGQKKNPGECRRACTALGYPGYKCGKVVRWPGDPDY